MKMLRKTIRKILLENNEYFDKLATMITSGNVENIQSAMELAETLEYVTDVIYVPAPLAWDRTKTVHKWQFDAVQGLSDAIEQKRKTIRHQNPDFGVRLNQPYPGATIIRQIVSQQ